MPEAGQSTAVLLTAAMAAAAITLALAGSGRDRVEP